MALPSTLARDISPPPTRKPSGTRCSAAESISAEPQIQHEQHDDSNGPSLAAIEAGEAQVRDHLAYFAHHFRFTSRETPSSLPRITLDEFQDIYKRNQHARGCHFVVHQHDHPISGNALRVLVVASVLC